ncbi:hypothetical protein FUA23_12435 [Neolewinella aurantiaca]|uniref:Uncharacterized protein n=1 Tax=Neolewinella aurantiaca TaxID=2602767 RepID=A0A5C7FRV1_9BACT|nr:hypothetical protein [Neolewinella aurantiaca]TXF88866.1 hypothetical protein FUA23_12435 [Neolewinella aurantiaca]
MLRKRLIDSYWNARKSLASGDLMSSIQYLEAYSNELPEDIAYEPHYWLVKQYLIAGDFENAYESACIYLEGCTPAHAALKAKLFSGWFQEKKSMNYSFALLRLSGKYQQIQKESRKK